MNDLFLTVYREEFEKLEEECRAEKQHEWMLSFPGRSWDDVVMYYYAEELQRRVCSRLSLTEDEYIKLAVANEIPLSWSHYTSPDGYYAWLEANGYEWAISEG